MNMNMKPKFALGCGAIALAAMVCQPVQATPLLNESGTSILADVNGPVTPDNPASEQLTVDWSVVENASSVYTYTYTVYNPVGDILLPGSPAPGQPEEFQTFTLDIFNSFNTGVVLGGSISGGSFNQNTGEGIFWLIPQVFGGDNSGPLSFQSDLPPELGNASATDSDPPSPWSSVPYGQQVPIPTPDSTSTFALLGGMLVILPVAARMGRKAVLA